MKVPLMNIPTTELLLPCLVTTELVLTAPSSSYATTVRDESPDSPHATVYSEPSEY